MASRENPWRAGLLILAGIVGLFAALAVLSCCGVVAVLRSIGPVETPTQRLVRVAKATADGPFHLDDFPQPTAAERAAVHPELAEFREAVLAEEKLIVAWLKGPPAKDHPVPVLVQHKWGPHLLDHDPMFKYLRFAYTRDGSSYDHLFTIRNGRVVGSGGFAPLVNPNNWTFDVLKKAKANKPGPPEPP